VQVRDKEEKEVIVNDVFNWQHGWGKMRMGMDVDVDAAGTGRSLSVCKQPGRARTANAFPFVPLDRQAFASRRGRSFFPPCLDCQYSELCSQCRVHNVTTVSGTIVHRSES
jgi:hypothetical protein